MTVEFVHYSSETLPIPDVDCGDVKPEECDTSMAYPAGILNDRPDLAVKFFEKAVALWPTDA